MLSVYSRRTCFVLLTFGRRRISACGIVSTTVADASTDPDVLARLLRRRASEGRLDINVVGDSMAGVIRPDSRVVIEPQDRPRPGQVWAMVADSGQVVVHRVRRIEGDMLVGRGSGNSLDDEPLPLSRLVGVVVAAVDPDGGIRKFGRGDRILSSIVFQAKARARTVLDRFWVIRPT